MFSVIILLSAIELVRLTSGARWRSLTPQSGRLLIWLRSWAKVRLAKSAAAVARKSCIVDVFVCVLSDDENDEYAVNGTL